MTDDKKDDEEPYRKYGQELTDYMHLEIEEVHQPDSAMEKSIVPESVREGSFWRHFHTRRKILVSRTAAFLKDTKKMLVVWLILVAVIAVGSFFDLDQRVVGGTVLVFGLVSSAFAWLAAGLLSVVGLIPFIGPLLVTILSSSLLWIINALGYFVSIVAIRAGHGKTVLNYRLLVIVFLAGLVMGYVVARVVQ